MDEGKNIVKVFDYLIEFYKEMSLLFKDIGELMGNEGWYRDRTEATSHLSYSLDKPSRWLSKYTYRVYKNKEEPGIYRTVLAVYKWGTKITEPIFFIGKMYDVEYKKFSPFNFWKNQEETQPNGKIIEGIYEVNGEEKYKYRWTAIPLMEIRNKEDVKEKIVEKLLSL